jgi:hypothetical protein
MIETGRVIYEHRRDGAAIVLGTALCALPELEREILGEQFVGGVRQALERDAKKLPPKP